MGNTILIVEDNEHLQRILGSIVEFFRYRTLAASTGAQAIDIAITAKPNLIWSASIFPTSPVRRLPATTPAIRFHPIFRLLRVAPFSSEVEREHAPRAGIVDYLQKPITSETLQARIAKFILKESDILAAKDATFS
jgi:CheY-like chemotaxis protein